MVHTCIYFKNITENQENYKNWFSEAEFPFCIPYNLPYLLVWCHCNCKHTPRLIPTNQADSHCSLAIIIYSSNHSRPSGFLISEM